MLKNVKTPLSVPVTSHDRKEVLYSAPRYDCNQYVGETKRLLKKREKEHISYNTRRHPEKML